MAGGLETRLLQSQAEPMAPIDPLSCEFGQEWIILGSDTGSSSGQGAARNWFKVESAALDATEGLGLSEMLLATGRGH